jgi:hypothetical protein
MYGIYGPLGDRARRSEQSSYISNFVSLILSTYPVSLCKSDIPVRVVPIDPSHLQPPLFPKKSSDKRGTLLTPPRQELTWRGKILQMFWEIGDFLRDPRIRYAIKTGIGGGESIHLHFHIHTLLLLHIAR